MLYKASLLPIIYVTPPNTTPLVCTSGPLYSRIHCNCIGTLYIYILYRISYIYISTVCVSCTPVYVCKLMNSDF